MPTTQSMAETGAKSAATDLRILAGYDLGPSGDSWQDVAGTASVMLHSFAKSLEQARAGELDLAGILAAFMDEIERD